MHLKLELPARFFLVMAIGHFGQWSVTLNTIFAQEFHCVVLDSDLTNEKDLPSIILDKVHKGFGTEGVENVGKIAVDWPRGTSVVFCYSGFDAYRIPMDVVEHRFEKHLEIGTLKKLNVLLSQLGIHVSSVGYLLNLTEWESRNMVCRLFATESETASKPMFEIVAHTQSPRVRNNFFEDFSKLVQAHGPNTIRVKGPVQSDAISVYDFGSSLCRYSEKVVVPAALTTGVKLSLQISEKSLVDSFCNVHHIQVSNIRVDGSPSELVYSINGSVFGMGNHGLLEIKAYLRNLRPGTWIVIPTMQRSTETMGPPNLRIESQYLPRHIEQSIVEIITTAEQLGCVVVPLRHQTQLKDELQLDQGTFLYWYLKMNGNVGESARLFLQSGQIQDAQLHADNIDMTIGWQNYDAATPRSDRVSGRWMERKPEKDYPVIVNNAAIGTGVLGFEKALQEVARIPDGSTIGVSVCLRTRPPFVRPIVLNGLRHVERTGFEPYFDLLPLLVHAAASKKHRIIWLADEGDSFVTLKN